MVTQSPHGLKISTESASGLQQLQPEKRSLDQEWTQKLKNLSTEISTYTGRNRRN